MEIDFYSLEELLNVEVEVASLFMKDELVVGSTVLSITPEKWKRPGARRNHEALNNEMEKCSQGENDVSRKQGRSRRHWLLMSDFKNTVPSFFVSYRLRSRFVLVKGMLREFFAGFPCF